MKSLTALVTILVFTLLLLQCGGKNSQARKYLTELQDGRLLCTCSNYHVPFGVSEILSEDGGKTWDRDNTIRLSTSNGYWVDWVVTLELPDYSLITSYAATTYPNQPPDKFTSEMVHWNMLN